MRVLFLAHSYPRFEGDAAGSFLLRLAQALAAADVGVHVVAPGAAGLAAEEVLGGIPVLRFRYAPRPHETLAYGGNMAELVRSSWPARAALVSFLGAGLAAAVRVQRRHRADLVHAHWWFPGGLVGRFAAPLGSRPLVTTLHGTDVRLARDIGAARAPFRTVLRASRAVTAVSTFLAQTASRLAPDVPIDVAPMPVATELFAGEAGQGTREGGTRGDDLLFVGRLTAQKGIDKLLRALAAAGGRRHLDVVGDGPEGAALRQLASELELGDRVRWHGAQPQPALARFYRRAAALVVPSHEEGLGLVAVEAMLAETPVIAFDSGGLRDVVQPDVSGVLVPPGDAAALARAIDDLLAPTAADRRARLGAAGRAHALAAFAPGAVAARYRSIYDRALRAAGGPP